MPTSEQIKETVEAINDQQSFIQNLLIDTLGWQIPVEVKEIEDISFGWTQEELGANDLDQHLIDGQIFQIQSMIENQPWGIFVLEFANEEVFTTGRGLTGPLRKVLRGLVPKRRRQANLPAWDRENLLFICTHDYKYFRFAYFKAPQSKEKTAPLALFGWNKGDTDIRTLCEHNLPYLGWDENDPDMSKWRDAFSIEKVTKNFYRSYADVFQRTENAISENNEIHEDELRLFTQTLFNRLMFLRFIEKKGWLQFGDNTKYLANLYAAGGIAGQSFYQSRLMPLFFEALAVEGMQESETIGKVPFLNGGLFEKIDGLDDKVNDIPDEAFIPILGQDGIFYRYNFTVEESTPLDIEVAVDPEMLGKVFEELVTGRHESGSYYTPRPIVAFMCREAIKGYLVEKTTASKKAIELLVDEHEIAGDLTNKHAEEILFYLETLKAVDPACGSGAYLLGLLQELIEIRKTLQNQELKADPEFIYKLKLRLISHCLYGIDIDLFATNIAKLRLWLSLAIESDTPQPLPNLDFKIETGDAVLGPCDIFADSPDALVMSALRQKAHHLVLKKDQYMLAHGDEKKELYDEIVAEEGQIAKETGTVVGEGVIAWHVHFAEVFTRGRKTESTFDGRFGFMADAHKQKAFKITSFEPGGFDIVLANPPYIRQELIKEIKPKLKEIYPETFSGTADLYTYFYTRAVELLGPGGMLSFISSNKWFRANYGKKIRNYIARKCHVHSITDFGELPVFETAATFPMIFVAQKTKEKKETTFTQVKSLKSPYPEVKAIIQQNGNMLPADAIEGDSWNLTDTNTLKILKRIENIGEPIEEYIGRKMYVGIKTGFNKAFIINESTRKQIISEDPASKDLIKTAIKGDDVRKWSIQRDKQWIILTYIGVDIKKYPGIFNHLKKWEDKLKNRSDQGEYWWELRACSYYNLFEKSNIFFPDIAKESRFSLSTKGTYAEMTAFFMPSNDLYLLGILNSSIAWKYFSLTAAVLGDADKGGRIRLKRQYVRKLSVPKASSTNKIAIEKLVQKCLDAKGQNCEKWEAEIDQIVAKLYGLTKEEIEIVEGKK